jgi:hypothetical protein
VGAAPTSRATVVDAGGTTTYFVNLSRRRDHMVLDLGTFCGPVSCVEVTGSD